MMRKDTIKNWLGEHKEHIEAVAAGSLVLGIASSMSIVTSKVCDVIIYKALKVKL